jgi:hypothetical protein
MRTRLSLATIFLSGTVVLLVAVLVGERQGAAQPPQAAPAAAEPAPPAGQTYIGVMKCAACHFDKYTDWKKAQEKHVKALEIVPAAYQQNPACLQCHTTGNGQASGYNPATPDKNLAAVTCEACHGPGSAHADISKPFANKKPLPPEDEKLARDSIYKMLPTNVCVTCHMSRSHKKHPEYTK